MGDDQGFRAYLQTHMDAHGWTKADLARKSGIDASLIGRWLNGASTPSVERARTLAATIGRPILEILVAAGHLRSDDVDLASVPADPTTLSNYQLLAELERRLNSPERVFDNGGGEARFVEGPRKRGQRKRAQ